MAGNERSRAVIIGGGLAGLSAGHRLSGDGWDVLLLEKDGEVGGRCRTEPSDGYLFDTGAQYFRDSYDSTLKTAIKLGLGDRFRIPPEPRGIYSEGKISGFVPRSVNPVTLLPWASIGAGSMRDMLAVTVPFLRWYRSYNIRFPHWWTHGDDETAADFLSRNTTAAYRRNLAEPVASYYDGVGLDRLSAAGFMVALRYTFADRTGNFAGGMGSLSSSLAGGLEVKTGMKAEEVVIEGKSVIGVKARPTGGGRARRYRADFVVCAVPAFEAGRIVGKLGITARQLIGSTSYSPHTVVNLGFESDVAEKAGLVLLPGSEGFRASWISTNRSKGLEHAPAGSTVVTLVFTSEESTRLAALGEEDVVEVALQEASRSLGIDSPSPDAFRVDLHPEGRPIVSTGRATRLRQLWKVGSGVQGLALAGDWVASPTVEGAVMSGFHAADLAAGFEARSRAGGSESEGDADGQEE